MRRIEAVMMADRAAARGSWVLGVDEVKFCSRRSLTAWAGLAAFGQGWGAAAGERRGCWRGERPPGERPAFAGRHLIDAAMFAKACSVLMPYLRASAVGTFSVGSVKAGAESGRTQHDIDVVTMLEVRQGGLEPTLTDVAEGAHDVRPDFYTSTKTIPAAPGLFRAKGTRRDSVEEGLNARLLPAGPRRGDAVAGHASRIFWYISLPQLGVGQGAVEVDVLGAAELNERL
ncbi:MAG: hypothetical protein R2703_04945 [Micropruina glycogenica]